MARILGLDIDPYGVRAAWLESSFRSAQLTGVGFAPIHTPPGSEGHDEAVVEAVRSVLLGHKAPDQVITSMRGADVSIHSIELPAALAGRLAEVLPQEVSEVIPFDLDQVVIDHQLEQQTKTHVRVLVAAVRKEDVRARLDLLRRAGAEPRELGAGAASLDGLVALLPSLASAEGPQLLVHLGDEETDCCLVVAGRTVFARSLSLGADAVDSGRAGLLAQELARCIAATRARGYDAPTRVHVSGVRHPSYLAATLEAVLAVPTVALELPAVPGVDPTVLPAFARAAALTARPLRKGRRFDFRKGEFSPPRAIHGLREHAGKLAFGAALVFVSFAFSSYIRFQVVASERAALETQLRATTKDLFGTEAATETEARALMTGGTRITDPRPQYDALGVLDIVTGKIPATVHHETQRLRIEVDDEAREATFEIAGSLPTIGDRDTIATGLEQHECVTQIERGPMTPMPNNAGQNYRLEGAFQCPADVAAAQAGERAQGGDR